jgi:hypothetical protein
MSVRALIAFKEIVLSPPTQDFEFLLMPVTRDFSSDQGKRGATRRCTYSTPHKEIRSLTQSAILVLGFRGVGELVRCKAAGRR